MRRTIEQELALNGHAFIQTVGISMEPMLHNRESTVVIKAKKGPLKKDDVDLFRRPTDEYVLHRVIKVLNGTYLIRGDNCIQEENVPEEWVIGVMIGYYEDEKNEYISCESATYLRYLRNLKIRRFVQQCHFILKRIYRKLFQKCRRK